MVDAGEKYASECSVNFLSASGVSLDNAVAVACAGYS